MARNEEKQIARLNRVYLEKQKQEELKKRPPRPRLGTLNTPRELRKWLPTITRDIEFYVKQMEVTCYTDQKIEEFKDQIEHLRQEYRAYIHKLRALEPELNTTFWTNRPYSQRKRHTDINSGQAVTESTDDSEEPGAKKSLTPASSNAPPHHLVPISTPVLQHMSSMALSLYNCQQPNPPVWNVNPDTQDQPLQFESPAPSTTLAVCHHRSDVVSAGSSNTDCSVDHHYRGKKAMEFAASFRSGNFCVSHSEDGSFQCTAARAQLAISQQADAESSDSLTSVRTSNSSEDMNSSPSLPSLLVLASADRIKSANTASTDTETLKHSAENLMIHRAHPTERIHTTCSDTMKGKNSSKWSSHIVENLIGISGAENLACGEQNMKVEAFPSARENGCVQDTAGHAGMSKAASLKEQSQGLSSPALNSSSHYNQPTSSNPLNLDYSDSSDEDV